MIDLTVRDLVKSFEVGNNILDGVTFEVNTGERIGILGRNGCGKTTLFRILCGALSPDSGEISLASGRRLGLISQIPVYPEGWTTEDVLRDAHRRLYQIEDKLTDLAERMEMDDSAALLSEYDRLSEEFRRLGGYEMDFERDRVANGLDIPAAMRAQPFESLSGGEKTRVNLARLILEDTDILLLDEPTNHLDLRATEWLEEYLLHFHGSVLVISHDRYFLDRVVQRSIDLSTGKAEFYSGNYSFYVVERQRRFDEQLKQYEKDQAKLKQLTEAAEKLHLWAFMGNDKLHKRAFSMEKRIEKLEQTKRPTQERNGDRTLFSDVALSVTGGERIALIGDNGAGKTTFLKLLMNQESPDTGYLRRGPTVRVAYLPQIVRFEDDERSMVDTMLYECKCQPQEARDRLGAFGFRGEDVFKSVSALSGGERSRLKLCMLMGSEINFLVLDEPTNHLDIASREWIEDALSDYGEALLFVSHDRYFIEKFATRIWALSDGVLTDFRGTFEEYRAYAQRQESLRQTARAAERKKEPKPKKKQNQSPEKQLQKLERAIEKAESAVAALDAEAETFAADYQKLLEIEEKKAVLQTELDGLYAEWEAIAE